MIYTHIPTKPFYLFGTGDQFTYGLHTAITLSKGYRVLLPLSSTFVLNLASILSRRGNSWKTVPPTVVLLLNGSVWHSLHIRSTLFDFLSSIEWRNPPTVGKKAAAEGSPVHNFFPEHRPKPILHGFIAYTSKHFIVQKLLCFLQVLSPTCISAFTVAFTSGSLPYP